MRKPAPACCLLCKSVGPQAIEKHYWLVGGLRAEKNEQQVEDFIWNAQKQESEKKGNSQ